MRECVLLIGTNHRHQIVGCPEGKSKKFAQFIRRVINERKIQALAEELNEEAFPKWLGYDSIARVVASELGIEHIYCDPTTSERVRLGIPTTDQITSNLGYGKFLNASETKKLEDEAQMFWPQREFYWFSRIRSLGCNKTLFVLGSSHIQSFRKLLLAQNIRPIIIHENWKPS